MSTAPPFKVMPLSSREGRSHPGEAHAHWLEADGFWTVHRVGSLAGVIVYCLTTVVLPSVHGFPLRAPSTQKKCRTSPGTNNAM